MIFITDWWLVTLHYIFEYTTIYLLGELKIHNFFLFSTIVCMCAIEDTNTCAQACRMHSCSALTLGSPLSNSAPLKVTPWRDQMFPPAPVWIVMAAQYILYPDPLSYLGICQHHGYGEVLDVALGSISRLCRQRECEAAWELVRRGFAWSMFGVWGREGGSGWRTVRQHH